MMPSALPEHGKTNSRETDKTYSRPTSGHSVPYMDENLPSANPYYVPQLRKRGISGRNDPCPCGSGRKFKNCHWRQRTR